MKKLIIFIIIVVLIPTLLVKPFKKNYKSISFYGVKENQKVRVKRNNKNIVEIIPIEDYVIGVVAGEMPVSFNKEALKAQAVASRTYVLYKINKEKLYDVDDGTNSQVYLDTDDLKKKWGQAYEKNYNYIKNIVNETKGKVILYNNKIIDAMFFSTSNGYTENSEDVFTSSLPYLKSVLSKWDEEESPVFKSVYEIDINTFLSSLSLPQSDKVIVTEIKKTNTGRIMTLKINGTLFNSSDIRKVFGLKSTSFDIVQNNNKITFNVTGNGHGVGMSQYGANAMAKQGYNYIDILKYYYVNCEIK